MQAHFSIILPLLAIRLFLNPVPSFPLLCPSPPSFTATAKYSYLNYIPAASLVFIHRASPFRPTSTSIRRNILFILLLSGDVEINPGPNSPFSQCPPKFSNETFTLYSLNIWSLLNTKNSTALTDLTSCSRPPDLIALQETKMSISSTDAHISYSKPPSYSLVSFPRITPSSKSPQISGGGPAFLLREPAIVLNSSRHTFKSFECSCITLQLASNILLMPITPGSPHTSKHLKPFAGTSRMYTSEPSTPQKDLSEMQAILGMYRVQFFTGYRVPGIKTVFYRVRVPSI